MTNDDFQDYLGYDPFTSEDVDANAPQVPMDRVRCSKLTDHLSTAELFQLALFIADELGHGLYDYDASKHIDFEYGSSGIYRRIEKGEIDEH